MQMPQVHDRPSALSRHNPGRTLKQNPLLNEEKREIVIFAVNRCLTDDIPLSLRLEGFDTACLTEHIELYKKYYEGSLEIDIEYLEKSGEDFRILVLPDHPTPIATRTHSSEPVPFFLYDSAKTENGVLKLNLGSGEGYYVVPFKA